MSRTKAAEVRDQELTALVEGQQGRLRSVIRKRIGDSFEAEDILQDVFAQYIEAYDLGLAIESLSAWLVTVAKNRILDRFRRRKVQEEFRERALASPDIERRPRQPDEESVRSWLRREMADALQALPREQREVFVKHELEGRSFEEISAETGVGLNTLLARKRYAVLYLRKHLKEVYDELE